MKRISLLFLGLLALVCMACSGSSPQQAGEKNFTKAINAYLQQEGITINIGKKMPIEMEDELITPAEEINRLLISRDAPTMIPSLKQPQIGNRKTSLKDRCQALERAGILTSTERIIEKEAPFFRGNPPLIVKYKVKKYDLSEKGKQLVRKPDVVHTGYRVRIATARVDQIKNFSSPTPVKGYTVSKVNFTYSPDEIEPWAKSDEIEKSFPIKKKLQRNQADHATLVLMGDGWAHGFAVADQIK